MVPFAPVSAGALFLNFRNAVFTPPLAAGARMSASGGKRSRGSVVARTTEPRLQLHGEGRDRAALKSERQVRFCPSWGKSPYAVCIGEMTLALLRGNSSAQIELDKNQGNKLDAHQSLIALTELIDRAGIFPLPHQGCTSSLDAEPPLERINVVLETEIN
jgi:hypothetical protein